jgi:hypothetical protein
MRSGRGRLAFLAQGGHVALGAAIDACLARRDRSLRSRWRAISLLVRVRYEDHPTSAQPAASSAIAGPPTRVGPGVPEARGQTCQARRVDGR